MANKRKKEKPNLAWDKLNELHNSTVVYMTLPGLFIPLIKNPDYLKLVQNTVLLKSRCESLLNDLKNFGNFINEINSYHKNKTGSANTPDELMHCLSIGERYIEWSVRFNDIVTPKVTEILEMFGFDYSKPNEVIVEIQKIINKPVIKDFQTHLQNVGLNDTSEFLNDFVYDPSSTTNTNDGI